MLHPVAADYSCKPGDVKRSTCKSRFICHLWIAHKYKLYINNPQIKRLYIRYVYVAIVWGDNTKAIQKFCNIIGSMSFPEIQHLLKLLYTCCVCVSQKWKLPGVTPVAFDYAVLHLSSHDPLFSSATMRHLPVNVPHVYPFIKCLNVQMLHLHCTDTHQAYVLVLCIWLIR